jgi:hypothetical protein
MIENYMNKRKDEEVGKKEWRERARESKRTRESKREQERT